MRIAIVVAAAVLAAAQARADEQLRTLVASGIWVALQHAPSMSAAPDVCLVVNSESNIAFRAGSDGGVELRVIDDAWSLPAGVSGVVKIDVGTEHYPLDITGNTSSTVVAEIEADRAAAIFGQMDNASSMTVTPGTAKPRRVSLAGSTKATNAFRTCAGITGSSPSGGSNPFAVAPTTPAGGGKKVP